MTQPAIPTPDQQGQLKVAVSLAKMQAYMTYPFLASLCTEPLTLLDKAFPRVDPVLQTILSCDGRYVASEKTRRWRGAMTMRFLANSRQLGWALAVGFGSASAASVVGAGNAVFTLTITATGGTYVLYFDGLPTAELAYNDNAAAIQAAVDARIGAGLLTVAGAGPYTFTAAGAYVNLEVRAPEVSTLKLTGGTATMAVTTPGGPARSSYTITQSQEDQPPAVTMVVGYEGSQAWRLADMVIDTLEIALDPVEGKYPVTINWIWSGLFDESAGFSWPACALQKELESEDSRLTLGSTDVSSKVKAYAYRFGNRVNVDAGYTNVRKVPQRLLRQWPLTNDYTAQFEEQLSDSAVLDVLMASAQDGTTTSLSSQIGSLSDGAVLTSAEVKARINGTIHEYDGGLARVPAIIKAMRSDATSTKPVSATVVTGYSGGYLASA